MFCGCVLFCYSFFFLLCGQGQVSWMRWRKEDLTSCFRKSNLQMVAFFLLGTDSCGGVEEGEWGRWAGPIQNALCFPTRAVSNTGSGWALAWRLGTYLCRGPPSCLERTLPHPPPPWQASWCLLNIMGGGRVHRLAHTCAKEAQPGNRVLLTCMPQMCSVCRQCLGIHVPLVVCHKTVTHAPRNGEWGKVRLDTLLPESTSLCGTRGHLF